MTLRIQLDAGDNTYLKGLDIQLHLGTKLSTGTARSRYTINIRNGSAVDKEFMIFTGEPTLSGSFVGSPSTYVFMDGFVAPGNTASFSFNTDVYAFCFQQSGSNAPQISVKGPVFLGTGNYRGESLRIALRNGVPRFVEDDPADAGENSFQISTSPDFNQGSKIYIGIAYMRDDGRVTMAAGVQASPNTTVAFTPSTTFYAAPGNSTTGTIIDASKVINKATFDVEFHSASSTAQYNPNGTWTQL